MYTLAIGDRTYSSWSLRGWLLFERFGIPCKTVTAHMYAPEFPKMLEAFAPARLVPAVLIDGDDMPVWDTLALAETLHERHPDAGLWPTDAKLRHLARSLAAEMHSGFATIRDECTMNLEYAYSDFVASDGVTSDLARAEKIWDVALNASGGPWLCGAYSAVDVFYAPFATRIATYGLSVSKQAQNYVDAHLADPAFRRWRAMGRAQNYQQPVYQLDFTHKRWPGPKPLSARAVTGVTPINTHCPYSGDPVADDSLAEINGQIVGFCNPFCRDKSVADAEAWPALMALLKG